MHRMAIWKLVQNMPCAAQVLSPTLVSLPVTKMTEVTSSLAYFWGFVGSASECSALSKDDSLEFGPQREVAPAAGLAPLAEATAGLAVGLAIGAGTAAFAVGVIHQA